MSRLSGITKQLLGLPLGTLIFTPADSGAVGTNFDVTGFTTEGTSALTGLAQPRDLAFAEGGLRVYVADDSTAAVYMYTMNTAYDIATITTASAILATNSDPQALWVSDDGTEVFTGHASLQDKLVRYQLATPYELSTAVTIAKVSSPGGSSIKGVHLSPDGTKLYILDSGSDTVKQWNLTSAYRIGTDTSTVIDGASPDGSFSISAGSPFGLHMSSDGTKMVIADQTDNTVDQFTLATPFEVSTATEDGVRIDISAEEVNVEGVFVTSAGDSMFIVGANQARIFKYAL
jgi:DNA-binding beta-propeller fold protein YncE